ncbi:acylase [Gloeocapsopsis crepidinum LEGE 06123]|uniref:Acylase n=4 Tax=Gloeocapsopsis crepidinum TaxID=693223 RepID=A0ABR9UPY2_9CHRO|nr:acylase [Gloeocapsopsis crepidinum LEGE 06123]
MQGRFWRFGLVVLGLIVVLLVGGYGRAILPTVTEILWDTYGVPHVFAKDARGAFQAFGWAQMQSHGDLLLRLYGQARGRAAEYWGENYLDSDRWVLTMGVPNRARRWYQLQSPAFQSYLEAFAAGINAYAQEHGNLIDDEVEVVLPVNPEDVLAHLQRVLYFTFVVNPAQVAGVEEKYSAGSNAWAIAPSHSANGHAMLLANPHLLWSDRFLWYEAQLQAPGVDVYGATLVGFPGLAIAFNNNLGWTYTVNTHDGWDAYELQLQDDGYLFDGKVRAFETENLTLRVKQQDGSARSQSLLVRRSVHGSVISQQDGKVLALRVVGLDQPGVLEQWWDMARAKNLTQFEAALQRLQLPMFTVMYADREGHIMHLFNGQVPIRQAGDYQYWSGIIPGETSKTLWTKYHAYQDLPRVVDPASGWLQNANDPPWTTTFPQVLDPTKFPAYMAPQFMHFRAQRSARMLDEDRQISFEKMMQYKHSTRMELSDRLIADLISAAREYGNELVRQAADVLESWDRQTEADSKGAVLFAAWTNEVKFPEVFATPWHADSPRTTPNGLANPQSAVKALETAASKVKQAYGTLNVRWGDVFQLQYGNQKLPGNGGFDALGVFRTVWFAPQKDGSFTSIGGDSYVAAIEFSNPIRAMTINSYGNSTQPHSQHNGDQLSLFAQKQLRPVWRSRREIQAHLEEHKVFKK